MKLKTDDHTIVQALWKERDLVFQEKLGAIKTSKQGMVFLIPILGLSIDLANKHNAVYLLIPLLICAFAFFILTNQYGLIWFTEYIARIDRELMKNISFPLPPFQMSMGELLQDLKFNISKGSGSLFPHPYYLFILAVFAVVLPVYVHSMVQGYLFLVANDYARFGVLFVVLCSAAFLLIIYSGYTLRTRRPTIQDMIDKHIFNLLQRQKKANSRAAGA